ncbi:MAG: FecR family protein [Xylophilus ampelinus]
MSDAAPTEGRAHPGEVTMGNLQMTRHNLARSGSIPASRLDAPSAGPPPCGATARAAWRDRDPGGRTRTAAAALLALAAAVAALHALPARAADAPAAQAPDAIALVKRVSGTVELVRGSARQPLQEGQPLVATDRLVSGADGMAAVVFRDGTRITVGASTDLHLRRYAFEPKSDDYAFDVYLAKGRTVYASGKIGKLAPQSVRLDTPTATVGVRGTRLILEAE